MPTPEKKGIPYTVELLGSTAAIVALAHIIKDENTARLITLGISPALAIGAFGNKWAARWFIAGAALSLISKDGWPYFAAAIGGLITWPIEATKKPRRNYDHKDDGEGIE